MSFELIFVYKMNNNIKWRAAIIEIYTLKIDRIELNGLSQIIQNCIS